MNVAQETLGFRRAGLSPALTLLMSAFALPIPPEPLTGLLRRPRERSPTMRHLRTASAASVTGLAPLHLPRRTTRSVSYYAFFKGWLLLSQPPDCFRLPTSFATEPIIRDLSWRSGLFPSRVRTLAPGALSPELTHFAVFGVCNGLVRRHAPLAITVLYPRE
jgi:hypothetical protein